MELQVPVQLIRLGSPAADASNEAQRETVPSVVQRVVGWVQTVQLLWMEARQMSLANDKNVLLQARSQQTIQKVGNRDAHTTEM